LVSEGVNWIHLAQDGVQEPSPVNTAINTYTSRKKVAEILTATKDGFAPCSYFCIVYIYEEQSVFFSEAEITSDIPLRKSHIKYNVISEISF
jgi:hypothetical protein